MNFPVVSLSVVWIKIPCLMFVRLILLNHIIVNISGTLLIHLNGVASAAFWLRRVFWIKRPLLNLWRLNEKIFWWYWSCSLSLRLVILDICAWLLWLFTSHICLSRINLTRQSTLLFSTPSLSKLLTFSHSFLRCYKNPRLVGCFTAPFFIVSFSYHSIQ